MTRAEDDRDLAHRALRGGGNEVLAHRRPEAHLSWRGMQCAGGEEREAIAHQQIEKSAGEHRLRVRNVEGARAVEFSIEREIERGAERGVGGAERELRAA